MTRQMREAVPVKVARSARRRGEAVAMHAHAQAQLLFAPSGTMQVYTTTGRWLVPPQLAVWIPAGIPHWTDILSDTDVWSIMWERKASRKWVPSANLERAFALRVTPLLRELIAAAFAEDAVVGKIELVVRLILHELTATPDAPTFLPLPTSPAARRIADLALADRRHLLDIDELASLAGTSARSLSRVFPAETGLTFKSWRQRARIVLAIDQMAAGRSIFQVASQSGFASTAAFSHAFRKVTGMTPTAFLANVQTNKITSNSTINI